LGPRQSITFWIFGRLAWSDPLSGLCWSTVRLHHLANRSSDVAVRHLCKELTATETVFPETNLRLIYELGSKHIPGDQEV
jgi:hypothetical protein